MSCTNLLDSQVARTTRRFLDDCLRSMAPDAELTPFMVAGGPHGLQHVGLHSLDDADFADTATTVIPAFIVLAEAVEVTLTAFTADSDICGDDMEGAFIAHWRRQGRGLFTSAVIRRNTQPPVLAGWLEHPAGTGLGPIDEGVRSGLDMAYRIWDSDADELRRRIDDIRAGAETSDTASIPLTLEALQGCGWLP